jgi:hypothetical protein
MKAKSTYILKVILAIMLGVIAGCDTWDDNININPNLPSSGLEEESSGDVDPSVFMIPMLWSTVEGYSYIQWNVMAAVCEYHGKTKSLSQGNRHKSWHAFDDSNLWPNLYGSVRNQKNMRNAAESIENQRYMSVADIWECFTFAIITNLYGDVPYFDAISDDPPLQSKYDPQSEIYPALLDKLRTAGELLNRQDAPVNSSTDLVFYGDVLKWKKFSNMLRIRLAMYMSHVAPDEAAVIIQEIVNDPQTYPIMDSNEDNALFHTDEVERLSRYYTLSKSKIEEAPFSNVFIERLISLRDPRLPVMSRPVRQVHESSETHILPSNPGPEKYAGHLYGITTDNAHAAQWNGGFPYASALGEYFRKEDANGIPLLESASVPYFLALYAEQEFFLAEAIEKGMVQGDAQLHYNNGIRASFDLYEVDFGSAAYQNAFGDQGLDGVDAYLSQQSVSYTGGQDKLTLIAEQKWIASFMLGLEPYFDHRRTMLPPFRASSGAENFGPNGSGSKFPSRAAYSDSEVANNPANVADARANGFDIPITDDESRNEAKMWIVQGVDLQMPVFQEPVYSSDYPVIGTDPNSGTSFMTWYENHWNSMLWWSNN